MIICVHCPSSFTSGFCLETWSDFAESQAVVKAMLTRRPAVRYLLFGTTGTVIRFQSNVRPLYFIVKHSKDPGKPYKVLSCLKVRARGNT